MRIKDRGAISRADLLWSFVTVAEDQRRALAEQLGFEFQPPPASPKVSTHKPTLPAQPKIAPTAPEKPVTDAAVSKIPAFYRVTDAQGTENETLELPEWFQQAQPLTLGMTESLIPKRHKTAKVVCLPLVSWSRLWPCLQGVLGAEIPGQQVDIRRLVKKVSKGERIRHIPKLTRYAWAARAQLLIDINPNNIVYRQDFFQLTDALTALRGEVGLSVRYIVDHPGGHVVYYQQDEECFEPWLYPEKDTPLLILSDMGLHRKGCRTVLQWLSFGQRLRGRGLRPTVLMPIAVRMLDQRLLNYFDCVLWDRTSSLKPLSEFCVTDYEDDRASATESVEHLMALCFPAMRVELGLLRSLRHLLPATAYDVGHESQVWHHHAVLSESDEWAWQPEKRALFLKKFQQQLTQFSDAQKHGLVEQIACYHAKLPDVLYFEAMHMLMNLKLPLPQDVKDATERYMAALIKTYDQERSHQGLVSWVKRFHARHQGVEAVVSSDYQTVLYILERIRLEGRSLAEMDWPAHIPPEHILAFLNRSSSEHVYLLRQQGTQLQLVPQDGIDTVALEDEWAIPGVTLLRLALRDTHIVHTYEVGGTLKQNSLQVTEKQGACFSLPPSQRHQFQIGAQRITVEALPVGQTAQWVVARGMEGENTFVTSRDQAGNEYTWYWHAPSWHPNQGVLRGVWYSDISGQLALPEWAERIDRDKYGIYVDARLAGVEQRFRWIEPGAFLMGSPENEVGRLDNETQHEVILTQGFWLADTTVTQTVWEAVMGNNPSNFKGPQHPVDSVSWGDAQRFIEILNNQASEPLYCLPTEAQWEYACRAGTQGAFNFVDELSLERINYRGTWGYKAEEWGKGAKRQTCDVGYYEANAWGLFEMHGNVWEWCEDWYDEYPADTLLDPVGPDQGNWRVCRGGSWFNSGRDLRAACRNDAWLIGFVSIGFRLARGHELKSVKQANKRMPDTRWTSRNAVAREGQLEEGRQEETSAESKNRGILKSIRKLWNRSKQ